jgi:hypothetical protein
VFDVTKIQTALNGVVGFRQPDNPAYAILDAPNQVSRSGRFVTDNPYAKIEFLKDNMDYKDLSDAEFNTRLLQLQNSAIAEVCGMVFDMPDYIDRQVLFKNANNKINTVTLPSGLVCYKLCVDSTKNIAFEIKRVFLDFEGAGDVRIMLFNSAKTNPIFSQDVTISSNHQVEQLNWKVDNSGDTYKGEYYLGYLSNDIDLGTLKPYDRDYNNSDIMSRITHMSVLRLYFPGVTLEELPDLETDEGLDLNLGINPDITVYDDYTDLIIQNEIILQRAIYFQMVIKTYNIYMASLRSNQNERESQRLMLRLVQQIDGQNIDGAAKITGLRPQLLGEVSKAKKEIKKIRAGYFTTKPVTHTLN